MKLAAMFNAKFGRQMQVQIRKGSHLNVDKSP